MRWLNILFSHSIFIAFCAVALCYQTYTILHLPAKNAVYALVFFSTLCSYNFYWLISKYSFRRPIFFNDFVKNNLSYVIVFLASGATVCVLLFQQPDTLLYLGFGLLLTLLYSLPLWPFDFARRLRKPGFLKTTMLAFTWAYVTTVIPVAPIEGGSWNSLLILFLARFCFMALLCIIFDRRDIKVDKVHALHSLATDVSVQTLDRIVLLAFGLYIVAGIAVRFHFRDNAQLVAFLVTGIAVWVVHAASRQPRGYIFYYFIVDGLMIFSAGATLVAATLFN